MAVAEAVETGLTGAKVLMCCFETIDRIIDLVSVATINDQNCSHILSQTAVIKKILQSLGTTQVKLSDTVLLGMDFILKKLGNCDKFIDDMFDRKLSRPRDFIQSRHYRRNLERMRSEIDSALTTFNTTLLVQMTCEQQGVMESLILSETKTGPIPGKPQDLTAAKRAHNRIKLQWNFPSTNHQTIGCYEVQYRRRWKQWESYEETSNTNQVIYRLSADTTYWFRVRAVNTKGFPGRYCEEICTETKYSPLARGFITAGAAVGGTIAAPIFVPLSGAVLTGLGIYDGAMGKKGELSKGEVATFTAGGVILAVSTPITGTVGAPVIGASIGMIVYDSLSSDDIDDDK